MVVVVGGGGGNEAGTSLRARRLLEIAGTGSGHSVLRGGR